MKKVLGRRPSPAMIIAVIALVAALGGTAIAGGGFLTKKKFQNQAVRGPLTYVTTTTQDTNDGFTSTSFKTATATCPPGTHVVGGGIKGEFPEDDFVFDSYPTTTGWSGRVFANHGSTGTTSTFITTAICATVKTISGAPPAS
jgi:hypothetical protein